MRILIALPLLLGACSGGDDQEPSPIETVVEEAQIEGGAAVQREIGGQAKSIEEAADKAVELIEAEARQESREVRPKSGETDSPE